VKPVAELPPSERIATHHTPKPTITTSATTATQNEGCRERRASHARPPPASGGVAVTGSSAGSTPVVDSLSGFAPALMCVQAPVGDAARGSRRNNAVNSAIPALRDLCEARHPFRSDPSAATPTTRRLVFSLLADERDGCGHVPSAGVTDDVTPNDRSGDQRDVDRTLAFNEGVFAIAITLLVSNLEIPDVAEKNLGDALEKLGAPLISYALSFAVIASYRNDPVRGGDRRSASRRKTCGSPSGRRA